MAGRLRPVLGIHDITGPVSITNWCDLSQRGWRLLCITS